MSQIMSNISNSVIMRQIFDWKRNKLENSENIILENSDHVRILIISTRIMIDSIEKFFDLSIFNQNSN